MMSLNEASNHLEKEELLSEGSLLDGVHGILYLIDPDRICIEGTFTSRDLEALCVWMRSNA